MALDLRNKRISKEKAEETIELYEGKKPRSLEIFLNFIGLTEKEFYTVAKSHLISPNKIDISKSNAKATHDFDLWNKNGSADREASKKMFNEWEDEQKTFNK
jgi:hypothetical protein